MENRNILHVLQSASRQPSESEFKFKVTGSSMDPFLKMGDEIYVKQMPVNSLVLGDVVVVLRENDVVTHRLIRIKDDAYYCKGDNSHIPDPAVGAEQIFGKVTAIERERKRIALESDYWIKRNHYLGLLGNMEYHLYGLGAAIIKPKSNNSKKHLHISVGRIIFSPFRAIMRLISR
ncbi:MAG: S24/S26 family peptidase [Anaerolineaceae bacterium]